MTLAKRNLLTAFALSLLAACGGGGSGGENGGNDGDAYTDLRNTFIGIDNKIDFTSQVDPSTLPVSGTANYEGSLAIATPAQVFIAGELNVSVNFNDDSFRGSATNFVNSDGFAYDGGLTITEGEIDKMANPNISVTFIGDIDGTITDPDDDFYTVDAVIVGDFYGNGERFIAGGIRGDVQSNVGDFTLDDDNAGFRAAR